MTQVQDKWARAFSEIEEAPKPAQAAEPFNERMRRAIESVDLNELETAPPIPAPPPKARETDPMRMSEGQLAFDRDRGMKRLPSVAPVKGEKFEDFQTRAYGIAEVPRPLETALAPTSAFLPPRYMVKPGVGTEVAARNAQRWKSQAEAVKPYLQRGEVTGMGEVSEFTPVEDPTSVAGKGWKSFVNGLEQTKMSLVGLSALGAGAAEQIGVAPDAAKNYVEKVESYARNVAEDISLATPEAGGRVEQAFYDVSGALPAFALQLAVGAGTGGAGFLTTAIGQGVGSQYIQSYNEGRDNGRGHDAASKWALADAAISGTVTGVTNLPILKVFVPAGKAAAPVVESAVKFAGLRAFARKALTGAAAESFQEGSENALTDAAIFLRRTSNPEDWEKFWNEHPDPEKEIIVNALRSAVAGGVIGAGAKVMIGDGPRAPGAGFSRPKTAEQELRSTVPALPPNATAEQVGEHLDRLAEVQAEADMAVMPDLRHQSRIGAALDIGGYSDADLSNIIAEGNTGQTAPLLGGHLPTQRFTVTPQVAADELYRRDQGVPSAMPRGVLSLGPDGQATDEAIAQWKATHQREALELASKPSISRADMERIVGRKDRSHNEAYRAALLQRIRNVPPTPGKAELDARQIAVELTGLEPEVAERVLRGMSPQTAEVVARAVRAADASGERTLDWIADLNGVDRNDVIELPQESLVEGQRRIGKAFETRGRRVRWFATKDSVATMGTSKGGDVWINADAPDPAAAWALAVHEHSDLLWGEESEAWAEAEALLDRFAPGALDGARNSYRRAMANANKQRLSDADLRREATSNLLEAVVRAFSLHISVKPDGSFDAAKAKELVDASPRFMARLARFLDRVWELLGGKRKPILTAEQRGILDSYTGGNAAALASVESRAAAVDAVGKVLGAVAAESETDGSQSIRRTSDQQKRIDLVFQMGRRSGLVAGQIEGQVQGRADGRKAALAEAAAKRRVELASMTAKTDAMRRRLLERVDRVRKAAFDKGDRAGRRAARKELRELLALAKDEVMRLPEKWRGKFTARIAAATTTTRQLRLVEDVAKALALVPVSAQRKEIDRVLKAVKGRKMRAETKAAAKAWLKDAKALLSSAGGGMIAYTSDSDLQARTMASAALVARTVAHVEAERMGFKDARDNRALLAQTREREMAARLAGLPDERPGVDSADAPESFLRRYWKNPNTDIHTMVAKIDGPGGGAFTDAVAGMFDGSALFSEKVHAVRGKMAEIVVANGWKSREDYGVRAGGEFGRDAAVKQTITVGGQDIQAPLGMVIALAASDVSTLERLPLVGFVWGSNKDAPPLMPTSAELAKIVADHGKMAGEIKALIERELGKDYFDAHFRLNGFTAPKEKGYFPTVRHGDPDPDAVDLAGAGGSQLANAMFRVQSNQIARVNSDKPFVIHDFMHVAEKQVQDMARFIAMAEPSRAYVTLITSRPIRELLNAKFGPDMKQRLFEWAQNGAGLGNGAQSWVDPLVNRATGAVLLTNVQTFLRQVGGIARMLSELKYSELAAGVAQMAVADYRAAVKAMERNGYFKERWQSSQVGRAASLEGGSLADVRRMKAALTGMVLSLKAAKGDLTNARYWNAVKNAARAAEQLANSTRTLEMFLRYIDRRIAMVAYFAHRSRGLTETQAVALAAQTVRRTQNASDRLDDAFMVARAKVKGDAIPRLMFPMSSDVMKAWNQAARMDSQTTAEKARTVTGLAANLAWSAAVRPSVGLFAAALGLAMAGDDDEEENVMMEEMQREGLADFKASAASGAVGAVGGFAGIALAPLAEYVMDEERRSLSSVGDQVLALRVLGDVSEGAKDLAKWGDARSAVKFGKAAATVTGVPAAPPVAIVDRIAGILSPSDERMLEILRRKKRDGTLNTAQKRLLGQIETRYTRDYNLKARANDVGSMTRQQQTRYQEAQERKASR